MEYRFGPISAQEHDSFLIGHPKEHFMQHSAWGKVKSAAGAWHSEQVGLFRDDVLVASSLLLYRKMPIFGSWIYYAPRGFVIDFQDQELLKVFTDHLRAYLKEKKVAYLLVDPDYYYQVTDAHDHVIKEKDDFVQRMTALGYVHQGFNMGFEATQPRFTFRLKLEGSLEEITNRFDRFTKKNLRQCQENQIEVYEEDNLELFFEIMHDTALRDNFLEYPKSYYETVYHTLKPLGMSNLYFAKYSPQKHLQAIQGQLEQADRDIQTAEAKYQAKPTAKMETQVKQAKEKKERFLKMQHTAETYLAQYPDGIVLSTGININTPNRGWTVFGGSRPILRELNANYGVTYQAIRNFQSQGMEFMDFFGTVGNPEDSSHPIGIHRFKKKFSGDYIEFPGEFHLIIRKGHYWAWKRLYPFALKVVRKLNKVRRKGEQE